MTTMGRCAREADVLRAAVGGWTGPGAEELTLHVAECARCVEVTAAAEAVREACTRDIGEARVPPSAVVWWRLERRLREDRARAARRPLTVVQGIAAAAGVGVTLGVLQVARPWMGAGVGAVTATTSAAWATVSGWSSVASQWMLPLTLMAAVVLVLAPTALYLGLVEE